MQTCSIRTPVGSLLKLLSCGFATGLVLLGPTKGEADDSRGAAGGPPGTAIVEVGLTERVLVDTVTGLAMSGFDPVAYFVTGAATPGSADFEAIWNGAAWRFTNEGNRAAFLADPEIYAPSFGGYDAASIAAGIATPANPMVFAIERDRLFLFKSERSRHEFLAAPGMVGAADAAWPALAGRLIR